jgi:SAM-dependent methyltransferase
MAFRPFGAEYGYARRWGPWERSLILRLGVLDLPTRMRARLILPYLCEAAPRSALDVGFGYGHWSFWLARDPSCRRIVAVDADASRVADARHVAATLGLESLEFRAGHVPDAVADLPPQSLDAVIAVEVLQYVAPLTACMQLLWGLLRPGGILLAHVPALGSMRPYDRHRLDVEELERLCEGAGFRVARLARTFGPYHRALFSVFGRIASRSQAAAAAVFPFLFVLACLRPIEHPRGDHRLLVALRPPSPAN